MRPIFLRILAGVKKAVPPASTEWQYRQADPDPSSTVIAHRSDHEHVPENQSGFPW